MIVVSNTSPLTNLAAIGQFNLLQALFDEIYVAESVVAELSPQGSTWPGAAELEEAHWIHVERVNNKSLVDALRLDLDFGEAETIALAIQLQADLVLLDEQTGRRAAQYLNLVVMGVVGLLIRAKKLGFLDEVRPHLDNLREHAGFYLSQSVYEHALQLTDESTS
jgi:predicted nucleic acid-binding protein